MSKKYNDLFDYNQKLAMEEELRKIKKPFYIPEYKEWDWGLVGDIKLDGISIDDSPDFCDISICSATYNGREMNDSELQFINDDKNFVQECLIKLKF